MSYKHWVFIFIFFCSNLGLAKPKNFPPEPCFLNPADLLDFIAELKQWDYKKCAQGLSPEPWQCAWDAALLEQVLLQFTDVHNDTFCFSVRRSFI